MMKARSWSKMRWDMLVLALMSVAIAVVGAFVFADQFVEAMQGENIAGWKLAIGLFLAIFFGSLASELLLEIKF